MDLDAKLGTTSAQPASPSSPAPSPLPSPAESGLCDAFQAVVDEYLIRHRSVLDVLSKYQESAARVNRALIKAVTVCGCVEISAGAQQFPVDGSLAELRNAMSTHLHGELCEHCLEVLDAEIGRTLFYLAAICNLAGLRLCDVISGETKRISALGIFNLT